MAILVKATAQGFLGSLREVGDVFEVADQDAFSKAWMEKVGGEKPEKSADKPNKSNTKAE